MASDRDFTPALGYQRLTPLYDFVIAVLTRERTWRKRLLRQVSPAPGERILDVGCGTGSLAILIKNREPAADLVGLDPDPEILRRAQLKSAQQGVNIVWRHGFLTNEEIGELQPLTKIVSSLVLHQTSLRQKRRILNRAFDLLSSDGELHIADYGLQGSRLMRGLFRLTVQSFDGIEDTQPNADGVLPELIREAGFVDVSVNDVIPTLTGSISLFSATKRSS